MTASASKEMKPSQFWRMCFDPHDPGVPDHIRVTPELGNGAFCVGMAADLHGPEGVCTCCPRRQP
jgi:hypothetical protein